MTLTRTLTAALVALSLAGCVHRTQAPKPSPPTWFKQGATPQDFAADEWACRQEVARVELAEGHGTLIRGTWEHNKWTQECLTAHGWQRQLR